MAFPARFAGQCSKCSQVINPGQFIAWSRRVDKSGKAIWHVDCQNPDAKPVEATLPELPSLPSLPTSGQSSGLDAVLANAILPIIQAKLNAKLDEAAVRSIVESELASLELPTKTLVLDKQTNETRELDGIVHKLFPKLLSLSHARLNTYLYGVSGGGKTTASAQVAKALDLPFYAISLNIQSTPSLLIGFKTANGDYAETDFYKWYTSGGVFLFDEYDNTSGNLQTTLNTALDNGVCSFPNGLAKRHPAAVCIAAGNTVGLGANGTYSSRQVMDSAARERFVFLKWEYDVELESKLARQVNPKNGDLWHTWIQLVRHETEKLNLKLLVSPRATLNGAKLLLDSMFTVEDVADLVLFKGADSDTRAKVLASNPLPKVVR